MSLGTWLYYKKKYKLLLFNQVKLPRKNKLILGLTYNRNWEVPKGWAIKYFNINSSFTFINSPDLVLEREFNDGKTEYKFLYNHVINKSTPKAFWFIDAHVATKEKIEYCNNFDFVFVAQSPYIEFVKKNTCCKNIFWLPLCYPDVPSSIIYNNNSPLFPVSFIGRSGAGYEKRNQMIEFLKNEYEDKFLSTSDYINPKKVIQQSFVTTNQSLKDDLNFRVFETMGFGTRLVTNYVPDIDKIEGIKNRLGCFNEFTDLKEIIDNILNGNSDLAFSVHNIQEWIKEKHTFKNRIAEMLQMIETGKQVEYK